MVEVSQSSRVTTGARAKRPVGASLVNPSLKRWVWSSIKWWVWFIL